MQQIMHIILGGGREHRKKKKFMESPLGEFTNNTNKYFLHFGFIVKQC